MTTTTTPLPDHLTLPGVACWCGNAELRVICPGSDGERSDLFAFALTRPVPTRGWCSVEHARGQGLPGLRSETAA